MAIGMISLVVGILLPNVFHPVSQLGKNLSHAVAGMLMGVSLPLNIWAAIHINRQARSGKS
jgi:hypothetical protein